MILTVEAVGSMRLTENPADSVLAAIVSLGGSRHMQ
jgi:hypothetical protein